MGFGVFGNKAELLLPISFWVVE